MAHTIIERMCPFFVVSSVEKSVAFYRDILGFETWHREPKEDPFFAIVGRGGAMLFMKSGMAEPVPNAKLDPEIRVGCLFGGARSGRPGSRI